MSGEPGFAIWPPYEVFYIESMRFRTSSALDSVDTVNFLITAVVRNEKDNLPQDWRRHLLDHLQNIVIQGAALSRFLWPPHDGENKMHQKRGQLLRKALSIKNDSPLKNRALRNQIEHFDELLDKYLQPGIVGNVLPDFIGDSRNKSEVPLHVFRGYFLDNGVFQILNSKFEINPLVEEIHNIGARLEEMNITGRLTFKNQNTSS